MVSHLPVASPWFARLAAPDAITGFTEPHVHLTLRANFWHVRGADRDLVVDSGCGVRALRDELPELFERDPLLVCTHAHFDHIGAAAEFAARAVHPAEAQLLAEPEWATLRGHDFPPELWEEMEQLGMPLSEVLISAMPAADFDLAAYAVAPAPATELLEEGDVLDLGDRRWTVLHLPGHSPGSIGLLEEATGTLLSGDAIYDGPLLDTLPGADVPAYLETVRRLRELPFHVVHAGHDPSFGRERLVELCDAYLDWRG